jgi:tetratricopeptide (TPR) repeat protein
MTGATQAETITQRAEERRGLPRRALDFVFGYDYFISYAWRDGMAYATALGRQLSADGYEVFLDQVRFVSGDDWKEVAGWTLRRTGQVILIGSPATLVSAPVLHEIKRFHETGRRIIPIDFGGSLKWHSDGPELFRYLPDEMIRIEESASALAVGPSAETIATLRRSFNLVRQDKKRLRAFAAIALVLFLLAVAALVFGVYAQLQRQRAEGTVAAATQSADQFVIDIATKLRNTAGLQLAEVDALLTDAGKMLGALHEFNPDSAPLVRSQAVFLRESSQTLLAAGDAQRALATAEGALDLLKGLQARGSAGPMADHDFAFTYDRLGDALKRLGRHGEALDNYSLALAIREKMANQSKDAREELARSLEYTGDELFRSDPEGASALYGRDFQIRKELASAFSDRGDPQEALAAAYERLARIAKYRGEDMLPDYREALALREKLAAEEPDNALLQASLGTTYDAIGAILSAQGCSDEARANLRKAAEIRRRLVEKAWDNADWQGKLAKTLERLARCAVQPAENYREANDILARLDRAGRLADDLRGVYAEVSERAKEFPAPPAGRGAP